MADQALKLAVMIDADNASHKIVDRLFEEIASIGEANVRRVYGDFSASNLNNWVQTAKQHGIRTHMAVANTKGKNASDIEMVIDAMDLLHSGRFDGFCLVTSDSDFTALALRLREQGMTVFGFGEKKTPPSFRQACNRFIYTENLGSDSKAPATENTMNNQSPIKALPLIRKAINQMESDEGWVSLAPLGSLLNKLASDFDTRSYGKAKLSDLLKAIDKIETRRHEKNGMQVRLKKLKFHLPNIVSINTS